MSLNLYIWEGGVSSGYHDDGTLVVLASSLTEARAIVRSRAEAMRDDESRWKNHEWDLDVAADASAKREPDLVITADQPAFVAFNGGGYD